MFIIGEHVKIRFKNRGSPCYFLSSRGQNIKNILKIGQKRLFLFTFFDSFFMAFLARKLIYTINIWFNFALGSFFELDNLLNSFISGVYAKRWSKCARISIQKLMQPKIWSMIFFLTLTVRGPFHRKDFKWKKIGGTGLISEKTKVLYAELNERAEAATGTYSVTGNSLQYIYSTLVTKNHRNIR